MSRGFYFGIRTPDDICIVFGCWGCDQVSTGISALVLPYHGWLEEPFHKGIRRDGVALGAHSSEYVRCLVTVSSDVMKFEPLESGRYF